MAASIWGAPDSVNAEGKIGRQVFTATASQTLFTLTDFIYVTGVGSLEVYKNGLILAPSAYTETSSSSFTLATGAALNDVVYARAQTEIVGEIPVVSANPATIGASKHVVVNAGATDFEGKTTAQVASDIGALTAADIGVTVQGYDADTPTVAASQGEMEAGSETAVRSMSPLRVAQARAVVPSNSKSANYTTVAVDAGKHILHPSSDNNARTFTIDSNANVPYEIGTVITFINLINTVTITVATDTLVFAGSGSTGNRTLAAYGMASAIKVESTKWIINGIGLT